MKQSNWLIEGIGLALTICVLLFFIAIIIAYPLVVIWLAAIAVIVYAAITNFTDEGD
jgi:hypothetical protein